MSLSIKLGDYQLGHGASFGQEDVNDASMSSQELQDLSKAMEAGHVQGGDITSAGQTNAGALKYESLDNALRLTQWKDSHIRFWKRVAKEAAYSTVEEFNVQTSYGQDRGGFWSEGELPEEENSLYTRKLEKVKYMGVSRGVTHVAQLVKNQVGDLYRKEISDGMLYLLQKADRGLFYADEAVVSDEWNGIYAQHLNMDNYSSLEQYMESDHVVDLRGGALKESNVEDACETLLRYYAHPDLLIGPPQIITDFSLQLFAQRRFNQSGGGNPGGTGLGQPVTKYFSRFATIDLEHDIFAVKGTSKAIGGTASSAKAPATPTPTSATPVVAAPLTRFADGAGDYYYAVSAINRYGESALVQVGGTITVATTEAVDLIFVSGGGAYAPEAYVIYRSEVDPSAAAASTDFYPIMTVPAAGTDVKRGSLVAGVDGAAALAVRDNNRFLPNTEEAMLLQSDKEIFGFKQLAPMMKMDLAVLAPINRFMILLYGTPILYVPSKTIRFINIGKFTIV
jgi:hypothetical protein